jgi:hypothetical protein
MNYSNSKPGLEHIRSMLPILKSEAAYLYRYGSFSSFDLKFKNMTSITQARLLYIAYTEGDSDVVFAANRLRNIAKVSFRSTDDLLVNFSSEEIVKLPVENEINNVIDKHVLTPEEEERIRLELKKACSLMGNLLVENAYWVILFPVAEANSLWIPAAEGYRAGSKTIHFDDHVYNKMGDVEKYNLIDKMKNAAFILHLHNHPTISSVLPSKADRDFSAYWKGIDPLFQTGIMRFFIIQENVAIEYAKTPTQRWLGVLNNNMVDGKEYYIFDDGSKYIGGWNNSKMHGYGLLIMSETKKYKGHFKKGKFEGIGTLIDKHNRYKGEFRNGLYDGVGTMHYSESWYYSGQWKNGFKHYEGKEVKKNIITYDGQWNNDNKHGLGVEYLSTGEKYIGEWNNGTKVGKGVYITSDGKEVNGIWIEKVIDTDYGLERKREFVKDNLIIKTKIDLPEAFLG